MDDFPDALAKAPNGGFCMEGLPPFLTKHLHDDNDDVDDAYDKDDDDDVGMREGLAHTFTPSRLPPLAIAAAILARPSTPQGWGLFAFLTFFLFTSRRTISIDTAVLTLPYYILGK